MVNQSIIAIAQRYLNIVRDELEFKNAYLFGSYAKDKQGTGSDIDIALIFSEINNFFDMQFRLMQLRRKIDLRIEPHPILEDEFNVNYPFAKEVLETGILIQLIPGEYDEHKKQGCFDG